LGWYQKIFLYRVYRSFAIFGPWYSSHNGPEEHTQEEEVVPCAFSYFLSPHTGLFFVCFRLRALTTPPPPRPDFVPLNHPTHPVHSLAWASFAFAPAANEVRITQHFGFVSYFTKSISFYAHFDGKLRVCCHGSALLAGRTAGVFGGSRKWDTLALILRPLTELGSSRKEAVAGLEGESGPEGTRRVPAAPP
jgi:hypothetical protein